MECSTIDPQRDSSWDELIQEHPEACVFHTSGWARVLGKTYGHRPAYLCFKTREQVMALIPLMEVSSPITGKRGVGLPFTDICPPLLSKGVSLDQIMNRICQEGRSRGWGHFEIRDAKAQGNSSSFGASLIAHTLELSGTQDEMYARFASATRRAIRKAERSDLTVRIATDRESVLEYYQIHARTRQRHGLPPQPVCFFKNIYQELLACGLGFVVLAHHNDRVVAGAMFLTYRNTAVFKFGASDLAGQQYRVNNLIMWSAIKRLCEMGCTHLHFGRTETSNVSLRRFKQGWGTTEAPINYLRIDPSSGEAILRKDLTTGWHTEVFRRLPLSLNRALGALLYPHLD